LNVKDTFRLVYNREDFSFLIRVNPRYLHPRYPRTILNFAKLNGIDLLFIAKVQKREGYKDRMKNSGFKCWENALFFAL